MLGNTRLLTDFGTYQHRRNLSPLTITNRGSRLYAFGLWIDKSLLVASPADIDAWLDAINPTPSTRGTYIGHLSSFYAWAVRAGHLAANPVDMVARPKAPTRLPRPTDDADLQLAFKVAQPRMRAWICLTALQGFRCCEISRLRVEDIDRRAMTIRAYGKGNKERIIDLHPDTLRALTTFGIPTAGFIFTNRTQGQGHLPILPNTVSRYIGLFYASIGSSARAHRNRHWFGTNFYAASRDILLTRDAMGHASSATTEGYTQVAGGRAREVIGSLTLGA